MIIKNLIKLSALSIVFLLPGCTVVNDAKAKLADMQMRNLTKKLPDGTKLHFNTNVRPTEAWNCKRIGRVQTYNWGKIQMEGQFHMGGAYDLLTKKAVTYLTENNLKANYVNINLPETRSLGISSSSRMSTHYDLAPDTQVQLIYFYCQTINPERTLGMTKRTSIGIGIGDGADAGHFD